MTYVGVREASEGRESHRIAGTAKAIEKDLNPDIPDIEKQIVQRSGHCCLPP